MLFESRRSESDIINTILQVTREGINKTQLEYKAKMSNTQLSRYLNKLMEEEIIEQKNNNGNTLYFLTDKGEILAKSLQQVIKILVE